MSYAPELGLAVLNALLDTGALGLVLADSQLQHLSISKALDASMQAAATLPELPAPTTLLRTALRRAIDTATTVADVQLQFVSHSNEQLSRWWGHCVPLHDGARRIVGAAAVLLDITEHHATTMRLQHNELLVRTTELQLANRELEAFSYTVSHDLRAPLRAINGYANLLLQDSADELPPPCRQHAHSIAAAAAHMGRMIDDLLRLSRSAERELERASVDLSALVREITNELHGLHPGRLVTTRIEPDCQAQCDGALIKIALHNLLENAWKYTSSRAAAQIEFGSCQSGGQNGGQPTWFVRDNGIGFDMSESGRLFAAFERLSSSQAFDGTGIGLATVRRVIQAHGGEISAASQPGAGATFYFTLCGEAAPVPRSDPAALVRPGPPRHSA